MADRAQAISSLKDAGDQRCLPALFEALCDPNAAISEAAESTVWEMFCQSGDPQVPPLAPHALFLTCVRSQFRAKSKGKPSVDFTSAGYDTPQLSSQRCAWGLAFSRWTHSWRRAWWR